MRKYRLLLSVIIIQLFALLFAGCGGGGDGGGNYACSYETRVTDGCDGYGFGDWETECFSFNSDDYEITPEEVCNNVTTGGYHCEANCCIDTEFQNVDLSSGYCS